MSGELERLEPTATMLGAFREWACTESATELLPGDTLVMYSDGVTEAGIEGGDDYGEERLIARMRAHQFEPAQRMVQSIQEDVAEWSTGARGDDVTVVALHGV